MSIAIAHVNIPCDANLFQRFLLENSGFPVGLFALSNAVYPSDSGSFLGNQSRGSIWHYFGFFWSSIAAFTPLILA
jgi:hypothetical protein